MVTIKNRSSEKRRHVQLKRFILFNSSETLQHKQKCHTRGDLSNEGKAIIITMKDSRQSTMLFNDEDNTGWSQESKNPSSYMTFKHNRTSKTLSTT